MKKSIVIFLLFLMATSFALTNVSGCQAIMASDTYILTQDLSGNPISIGAGTGCINIATSNVVLDCNGHGITGPGTLQTYGVSAGTGIVNVTVRNCTISNYTYGINLNLVNGALVEANTVFDAGSAIVIGTNSNNIMSKNNEYYSSQDGLDQTHHSNENISSIGDHIHDNGRYGIRLSGTSGVVIANSTIEENGDYDIYTALAFSSECRVSVDNVTGSGGRPIILVNSSTTISNMELSELLICRGNGIRVDNISVSGSDTLDNNGIFILVGSNINISNSTSNDNQYGLFAYYTDNLTVTDSTFNSNEQNGLYTRQGNWNILRRNIANRNGNGGIYINGPSSNNNLRNNSANGNGEEGFTLHDSFGVFAMNNASLNGKDGMYLFVANMSIENNNASWNNGTGIFIEASERITYRGNYFCDNNGSGLDLGKSAPDNLVTMNIGCRNGQGGFVLSSPKGASDNNIFDNNTAFGNQDGFVINSTISTGNTVRNNIARDNSNSGFLIEGSSGSAWERNNATNNEAGFIFNNGAHNHILRENVAHTGLVGFIFIGSSDNIMSDCLAYDNGMAGFYEIFGSWHSGGTDATTIVNSRFYNNGWEIVQASAYGRQFNITNSTLGSNSVRFSMLDSVNGDETGVPSYMINETGAPGPAPEGNASFWNKYVKIFFISDPLIDSLTFHWDDDEAQAFDESSMVLLTWNNTDWIVTPGQALDEGSNSLGALALTNITEDDYYGLFIASPADGNDDGEGDMPLSIEIETSCDGNLLTATSDQDVVEGARVVLDGVLEGFTDGNGEFEFSGCGESVLAYVNKNGHLPAQKTIVLVDCALCDDECSSDSECPDTMQCSGNECESVPCSCGKVVDHECVPYECCDGSDCGEGQTCLGNSCLEISQSECSIDSDCESSEYCKDGECADVSGECGYAEDHQWIAYECGNDGLCPRCSSGFACENNVCIEYDIDGPDSGNVGGQANITVSKKDGACRECDLQITSPSGKKSIGKTDDDGEFELGLLEIGEYQIVLVKDGETVAGTKVMSKGVVQEVAEQKPEEIRFDYISLIALVLLALAIILIIVFRRRK